MKEQVKTICLIIVFIVLLVAIAIFMNVKNKQENKENSTEQLKEVSVEVTDENFESEVIDSDKKVIIDFYATWCGPCKVLSPTLEEVARENEDIKLVKIDVDKNESLAYDYGITAMPTLVVIENGQEVNRSVGVISKDRVLELLGK